MRNTRPRTTRWRRIGATLAAAALTLTWAAAGAAAPSAHAADDVSGCSYAAEGSGTYASTICWIDFSTVSTAATDRAAGQQITLNLGSGYSASMTVRTMAPDLSDFPDAVNDADWPGLGPYVTPQAYEIPGDFGGLVRTDFGFGNSAYTGIAGKPFLWNAGAQPTASSFKLTISDIVVTGPNGQHPSFGLVAADAEDTQHGEYNSFRSDQPLSLLDEVNPHPDSALTTPNSGVHGSFAQKVQYNGDRTIANVEGLTQESETAPDLPSSNLLFAASSPTYIQQSYNGTSRNGSVYGFMLARNQVTTTILGGDGKLAATATGVDHASGVSATAAVASATDPAATVSATVRSTTSDATIVGQWGQVVDSTEASNDVLHGYSRTWKCDVNGETREDIFPNAIEADSFTMDATKLTPYDFVHCTVTYGAYPGLISWLKADATTQTKIEGSSWHGGVTPPAWDADGARGQILAAVPHDPQRARPRRPDVGEDRRGGRNPPGRIRVDADRARWCHDPHRGQRCGRPRSGRRGVPRQRRRPLG